jgi:4,5-DOPA dioxygenase extradiol
MTNTMPAVFVGHGSPMNIVGHNRWTQAWAALGAGLPRPRAILAVSAHWYVPATMVTAMAYPRTIHDFGGFPQELFEITYPAPGDPGLAGRVRALLAPVPVELDQKWGLDHGTWSVLSRIFPDADIPVVQLSIDRRQPPSFHYEVGRLLAPLRDEGVLLLGSGNLVHNIGAYDWDRPDAQVPDWASGFEEKVRDSLRSGKDAQIIDYPTMGPEAKLSVPTPDHYLPLLYILGSRKTEEDRNVPIEGFDGGSMSMLALRIG